MTEWYDAAMTVQEAIQGGWKFLSYEQKVRIGDTVRVKKLRRPLDWRDSIFLEAFVTLESVSDVEQVINASNQ